MQPSPLRPQLRLAGLLSSLAATAAAIGAVVLAFGHASSTPWLPDTPEAVEMATGCDHKASRRDRDACMKQVVARWQSHDRHLASSR